MCAAYVCVQRHAQLGKCENSALLLADAPLLARSLAHANKRCALENTLARYLASSRAHLSILYKAIDHYNNFTISDWSAART